MRKHQVDSEFAANNSDRGSTVREERSESLVEYSVFPSASSESGSFSWIRNGTNPDSPISIPTIFPANHSDSENDGSSESNETSPRFSHNSNSIVSLFPPARSATDSPENYEIIITNPPITITTSFSIPLIFPPSISETETDDSCSESNQSPRAAAQFSYPIVSLFPPARSETDSSSSKNDEIIIGQILPTANLRIFTYTELKVATKNFRPDTVLGEGGFGQVFKGLLKDKRQSKSGNWMVIAVKKLGLKSLQGIQEWQVNFFGRLSHPNLNKLLGYCWENRELFYIYEFMQKGSLENHLFGKWSAILPLPWDIRLKIAIGAARGLAFLHTCDKQVIYGDFKASNILLDGSYTAKISDVDFTKLGPSASHSNVMGTYGYAAPEYVATGPLFVKRDVYGFGVVLVELLTGLRALDTNRPSGKHNLVDWIKPYLSDIRKLKQSMDSRLEGNYPSKAAFHISQLALECLAAKPKLRPSMKEVLEKLEWFEATNERPREPRNHASHPMVHRQGQQLLHYRSPLHPRLDGNPAYQNSSRVR